MIRKIFVFLFVMLGVFSQVPNTNAFFGKIWDFVDIEKEIDDDTYIVGKDINIKENINWDLIVFWQNIDIKETVEQDLMIFWSKINVNAKVKDDIRIFWSTVNIKQEIKGDLLMFGWTVIIDEKANIWWDVLLNGWFFVLNSNIWRDLISNAKHIELNWIVDWNVKIKNWHNDSVKVWKNAKILGDLSYSSTKKNNKIERIVESWNVNYEEKIKSKRYMNDMIGYLIWWTSYNFYIFIFCAIFWLIFIFIFRKLFDKVADNFFQKPFMSFLLWFFFYFFTPFVLIALFLTLIWIPFAIFWFIRYIFVLFLWNLLNVLVYSALLIKKIWWYKKINFWIQMLIIIMFSLLFAILQLIDFFLVLWAIGAIMITKWDIFKKEM